MKSIAAVTFAFAFSVTQLTLADDTVRSHAGKQHATQSSAKVSTTHAQPPASVSRLNAAGKKQFGVQPNLRVRQNYPALAQPADREPLAMNVQRVPRNFRPAGITNQLGQSHKGGGANSNVQTGSVNNQPATSNRRSYFDALKRCRHERHDRHWWNRHCRTIVFINTGYYYLDTGYWYPAYGYSSTYDYYDYDGPIYTYANLLPDQVIANVQAALREAGYYVGPITGSLNPATRAAISNFQRDYGLIITGAVDEPTVQSLGLN